MLRMTIRMRRVGSPSRREGDSVDLGIRSQDAILSLLNNVLYISE
jgi:hypothetical protein